MSKAVKRKQDKSAVFGSSMSKEITALQQRLEKLKLAVEEKNDKIDQLQIIVDQYERKRRDVDGMKIVNNNLRRAKFNGCDSWGHVRRPKWSRRSRD